MEEANKNKTKQWENQTGAWTVSGSKKEHGITRPLLWWQCLVELSTLDSSSLSLPWMKAGEKQGKWKASRLLTLASNFLPLLPSICFPHSAPWHRKWTPPLSRLSLLFPLSILSLPLLLQHCTSQSFFPPKAAQGLRRLVLEMQSPKQKANHPENAGLPDSQPLWGLSYLHMIFHFYFSRFLSSDYFRSRLQHC